MRLIKVPRDGAVNKIELEDIIGHCTEKYGILSHTWARNGDESFPEVSYADVVAQRYTTMRAYDKIKAVMAKAQEDGCAYLWVDTCCIDKSSSAELTEAINSMYSWYSEATCCYAYLEDVRCGRHDTGVFDHVFNEALWFTRGW